MLNPELDDFISSELLSIGKETSDVVLISELPVRLYHLVDAVELDALLRTGVMQAWHSRLAAHVAVAPYGVSFVTQWLQQQSDRKPAGLQRIFLDAVIQGLNPCGTYFDCFLTRLYAIAIQPGLTTSKTTFSVGLRCAHLPCTTGLADSRATMLLQSAIYDEVIQRAIVDALFNRYAAYFGSTVERFGQTNATDLLLRCVDSLRRDLGAVMVRFRQPELRTQHEWLAIALCAHGHRDKDIRFDVVHGQFAPSVSVDICDDTGRQPACLAIDEIAINSPIPFALCQENLLARLRAPSARQFTRTRIRIVQAGEVAQ